MFWRLFGLDREVVQLLSTLYDNTCHNGRHKTSAKVEVYLGLLHFKKNLDPELLALIFGLTSDTSSGASTAYNIKERSLDFLETWVAQFYPSFTRHERMRHQFIIGNKCLLLVVDGTEQSVVKPKSSWMSSIFWSAKKKKFSINKLIGCTVDGLIMWLSDSYPGRYVDSEILEKELCFLVEDWDFELILADQGFEGFYIYFIIQSLILTFKLGNPRVIIPNDWINDSQLRSIRIQVENTINWLKLYDILSEQLRDKIGAKEIRILAKHHRNYFIGGGLVNYNIRWNKAFMLVRK